MDIEQLKLVLEMVGTATEGAMWFACAWLAKGFITSLVGYAFAGILVYKLSHAVLCLAAPFTSFHAMRTVDPTIHDKDGPVYTRHVNAIINTHRRGCEAIKAELNGQ